MGAAKRKAAPKGAAPRKKTKKATRNSKILFLLTIFQALLFIQLIFSFEDGFEINWKLGIYYIGFIILEWVYVAVYRLIFHRRNFEIELVAFFLSGIGLAVLGSSDPGAMKTQFAGFVAGVALFTFMTWFLGDIDRTMKFRPVVAGLALAILAVNIVLGEDHNGAKNWITYGSFSVQPSEFVKVAFVFVGAATLEKIQSSRNLWWFIGFSCACVGTLFILRDFGTAVIFFFTFLLIAFMRSGDLRTIFLACTSAVLGGWMIIQFKPYVAGRFSTYRKIWEFADEGGYQQTRTLIAIASGGLFGLGLGQGNLKHVIFSSTDLVFGIVVEELGLIIGVMVLACFIGFAVFAGRNAASSRSTFYSISAAAAAGLLLFQAGVNVFGVTDIIPLTGVTLPFISRGGSSIICCWGLLSFIKAADVRTYMKSYGESESLR